MTSLDLLGTVGVSLLLLAYLLLTVNRLRPDGLAYPALNTVGAGLAALTAYLQPYWPFVALEGTWTVVSALALVRALTRMRRLRRADRER